MLEKDLFDPSLLSELTEQSVNPPGNDQTLGSFYRILVEMVDNRHGLAHLINEVKKQRPATTHKHYVNLIFRSYQFLKFKQNDFSYANFKNITDWQAEIDKINKDADFLDNWMDLLENKSTTTTIYQRYAGTYAAISCLFNGHPIRVADMGCGGNHFLRGVDLKEPFVKLDDHTPRQIVTNLLSQGINLENGIAIDIENPDDQEVVAWGLACRFYPQELDQLDDVRNFEARIRKSKRVKFMSADLLGINWDSDGVKNLDAAVLNTILYQLQRPEQKFLIDNVKKVLTSKGVILVTDFARKDHEDPYHLLFNESWFNQRFTYRTFISGSLTDWKFLELFQWDNGRCKSVKPGEDFNKVFKY